MTDVGDKEVYFFKEQQVDLKSIAETS